MDGTQREFYNEKSCIAQTRVGVTSQRRLAPKMVGGGLMLTGWRPGVCLKDVRSCRH